ncbi:restriction endonuclease subunit S, partial [Thiolapillus sp.]|uniref:restriction endonuclease subunit S n=1 Tax=Thiolapillus sp. TaxID=2017437 RepID=UPI003AF93F09
MIENNTQTNQTLEQIAQAIFKSWFVDFEPVRAKMAVLEAGSTAEQAELAAMSVISAKDEVALQQLQAEQPDAYNELAQTAALFPAAMEESELGEIPEGWGVKRIDGMVERFSVGKKYSQKTASEKGSIPILDQGKSGIIGYHSDKPGVLASPEDPIIVFANHTCYMRLILHDFSAIQNVLPFKGKDLNIFWTYYATLGKQEFIEYKGHWPDFAIKEVVVPKIGLDRLFGERVSSLVKSSFQNEKQNSKLSELRDALLPRLLSGELPVGTTNEVSA